MHIPWLARFCCLSLRRSHQRSCKTQTRVGEEHREHVSSSNYKREAHWNQRQPQPIQSAAPLPFPPLPSPQESRKMASELHNAANCSDLSAAQTCQAREPCPPYGQRQRPPARLQRCLQHRQASNAHPKTQPAPLKAKVPGYIYLLSSFSAELSVPSRDDKKEIEKCLSW